MATVTLAQVQAMLAQQERRLTQQFEGRLKQVETSWQNKLTLALGKQETGKGRKRSVSKNPCFCCGGMSAVHRHRELGVPLDDKCRKQVETFRQGGMITERRAAWGTALRHIGANRLAQEMLVYIEGHNPGSTTAPSKKRKLLDEAPMAVDAPQHFCESECTICQDDADNQGSATLELPCTHTFHRKCVMPWLQENMNCPLCRADVRLEYPTGDLADVQVFAAKPCASAQQLPCAAPEAGGGTTCCSYVVEEATPPLGGQASCSGDVAMPMCSVGLPAASDVCNSLGLQPTPSNEWLLTGSVFDMDMSQLGTQLSEEKSCGSGSGGSACSSAAELPAPATSLASLVGSPSAAPGGLCGVTTTDTSKLQGSCAPAPMPCAANMYGVASKAPCEAASEGCKLDDDWLSFLRDKSDDGGGCA